MEPRYCHKYYTHRRDPAKKYTEFLYDVFIYTRTIKDMCGFHEKGELLSTAQRIAGDIHFSNTLVRSKA